MPPQLGAFSPRDSIPGVHPGHIPVVSSKWQGADQERRTERLIRSAEPASARSERSESRSGPAPLCNLDLSNIRCTAPPSAAEIDQEVPLLGGGEWFVRQKTIDGYTQLFAIDDPDGDFARRKSGPSAKKVVEHERPPPDEFQVIENRAKAVRRSRKNLMWAVRGLKGNRIFTLTKRGRIPTMREAWSLWGKFERMASMRFQGFQTIVVIEPHTDLGFHIHFVCNRFFDVTSMRLWWHRILTGERLKGVLYGAESPGNIEAGRPHSGEKIAKYLGKYLGKSFREVTGRLKGYACSKGIRKATVTGGRMARSTGAEVYHLRSMLEAQGFRNLRLFETMVMGRRFIWMEASRRDRGGYVSLIGR